MAPRKVNNQSTQSDNNPCAIVCTQAETIGSMKAAIEGQAATDTRIETSLKELMVAHLAEKKEIHEEFKELNIEFAKTNTTLQESVKSNQAIFIKYDAVLETINQYMRNSEIIKRDNVIAINELKDYIADDIKWKEVTDKRLSTLERTKWFWGTLAFGVGALIAALASMLTIIKNINETF